MIGRYLERARDVVKRAAREIAGRALDAFKDRREERDRAWRELAERTRGPDRDLEDERSDRVRDDRDRDHERSR